MKRLLLMKSLLVAAGLCVGASAWADWTTTTYDFTSMGDVTLTLSSTTSGYANRTQCYLPNEAVATDEDKMNSKIGFQKASETLSSSGLYFPADAYINIKDLQEGDIFVATFSGANLKAVNHVSGSYTNTEITADGAAQLAVWDNLTTNEKYFATSNTSFGFQTKQYLKITSIVIKHNDSENYLALFRLWESAASAYAAAAESSAKTTLGDVITTTKNLLQNESATESDYTTAYANLKRAIELLTASTGNATFSISTAPKGGDKVYSVYGMTATFGGTSDETWTHALTQDSRGWINQGAATLSGSLPTGRTFMKFEPVVDGSLTISSYLFTDATSFHAYLSDGTTVIEDKSFPKKGYEGSLGGNGTYPIAFSTTLQAGKTYYVYYSKYSSKGVENYPCGFWGFTFTPSYEVLGALDKSTDFLGATKDLTIAQGKKLTINFKNHGGSSNWFNWVLRTYQDDGIDYRFRADNYGVDNAGNSAWGADKITWDILVDGDVPNWSTIWTDFGTETANSDVEMEITYTAAGKLSVCATMTGSSKTYTHKMVCHNALTGDVKLQLGVWYSYLEYVGSTASDITTLSKTITAAKWATLCSDSPLDFTGIDGLTAYMVTGGSEGILTKSESLADVPANTGILLSGAAGTYNIPIVAASLTDATSNKLVGVTAEYNLAKDGGYVLLNDATNGIGFYKNPDAAFTVGANTAYLPSGFDSGSAPAFYSLFYSETTGVGAALVNSERVNNEVFNLNGQRVSQPTKGLYIVGGRKVVVK